MLTGGETAVEIAKSALDKKASGVVVLDMRGLLTFADYFVICSGASKTQVDTIVEHILRSLAKRKLRPSGTEGRKTGSWVLLDFGDVIAHVFEEETRGFYELEKLWLDAPKIPVPKEGDVKAKPAGKAARR